MTVSLEMFSNVQSGHDHTQSNYSIPMVEYTINDQLHQIVPRLHLGWGTWLQPPNHCIERCHCVQKCRLLFSSSPTSAFGRIQYGWGTWLLLSELTRSTSSSLLRALDSILVVGQLHNSLHQATVYLLKLPWTAQRVHLGSRPEWLSDCEWTAGLGCALVHTTVTAPRPTQMHCVLLYTALLLAKHLKC